MSDILELEIRLELQDYWYLVLKKQTREIKMDIKHVPSFFVAVTIWHT